MANETEFTANWEGDLYRDTVTFRFIELAMCAIEAAFTLEPALIEKYDNWLQKEPETKTDPMPLKHFTLAGKGQADITAMAYEGDFLVQFQTPEFAALVSVSYDLMKMDIQAARIIRFDGDMMRAVLWAEQTRAEWDDQLVDLQGERGK